MIEPQDSASPWWQTFIDAIERLPFSQQANRLANLSLMLSGRREWVAAKNLALRAWRRSRESGLGADDMVRKALVAVVPRYHTQISTDTKRIATWRAALESVVQPGMLALEIGAGSGVLAILAARAGAEVVSCEKDLVLAAFAEEIVKENRAGECVRILGKSSDELRIPEDLPRPADLMLLDVFGDGLLDFAPFDIIAHARRLLARGAIVMPARVSLEGALAHFQRWDRIVPTKVNGIDLGRLLNLSSLQTALDPGDADLSLRSSSESMLSATLPDRLTSQTGVSERTLISTGGAVNGVALWLRLELTAEHVLEAKPGVAPRGFYARPGFFAFRDRLETLTGDRCAVRLRWEGKSLGIELLSHEPQPALAEIPTVEL